MSEYFKENHYLRKRKQAGAKKYIKLLKKSKEININWKGRTKYFTGMNYKKLILNLKKIYNKIISKNINKD